MTGTATLTTSDRDLLKRVEKGDERALGALYDRYAGALYALAIRVTGEASDADEVVLDTFTQAWREAIRFRADRGSVGAWLTMMARSRALDLVRARGRRVRLADRASVADPERPGGVGGGWSPAPDLAAEQDERRAHVGAALDALSPPQREAIELAFYAGLSHSEIAERLNEPLGTVKTRLRLGMHRLRDVLRPYYFEPGV